MSPKKSSKKKSNEVEWVCYYCGHSFGKSVLGQGAKLGKCPACKRLQSGSGIAVVDEEISKYLRNAEKKLKDEERLRSSRD